MQLNDIGVKKVSPHLHPKDLKSKSLMLKFFYLVLSTCILVLVCSINTSSGETC